MRFLLRCILFFCMVGFMQSCYYQHEREAALETENEVKDSLSFIAQHHFGPGFNFVVHVDSMSLCTEIPSRAQLLTDTPDSLDVYRNDEIIVASVEFVPDDEVDSVWIKVARDQVTQGWIRESQLLASVSPDDPISLAIHYFSGNHLWGTIVLIVLVCVLLTIQMINRRYHLNPFFKLRLINSPYPVLLGLSMGGSAVFYASMQLFAAQTWTAYYFNPTLNPFAVSPLLGAFLLSVWLMILFFIATVDDALRQLRFWDAIFYLLMVVTVLAVLYLFFSLTTLIYIGYPLYLLFVVLMCYAYVKWIHPHYRCGCCGRPMRDKGVCPRCGTLNE